MPEKKKKRKITLRDVARAVAPVVGVYPKVSPFDTYSRSTGDIVSSAKSAVRRGRLVDKYGEKAVSATERKALSLSFRKKREAKEKQERAAEKKVLLKKIRTKVKKQTIERKKRP